MAEKAAAPKKEAKPKMTVGRLIGIARKKFKIAWYVSAVTLICILVVGGLTGRFAIFTLNESKLKDTWAILFLEMENVCDLIATTLVQATTRYEDYQNTGQKPALSFSFDGRSDSILQRVPASGRVPKKMEKLTIEDLGFDIKTSDLLQFTVLNGRTYLIKRRYQFQKRENTSRVYLDFFPVKLEKSIIEAAHANQSRTYIINRAGSIFFSNDKTITREALLKFPVMSYFVKNSIASGQTEIKNETGETIYAFFKEIPGTNLTLFSEVKRGDALEPVKQAEDQYWIVLLVAILFAGLIVQLPLAYIKNPLSKLITQTQRLSVGDFSIRAMSSGFGEVQILSESFGAMAASLSERDRKIQLLLVESRKKARLEKEILIAKGIQENLLPESMLPIDANVEVFTSYMPADEVAGDWYHYHFNEMLGETTIVISDVSGHGAGASMFTGIIAEIFEDIIERNRDQSFPMAEFASIINRRLLKFGRGGWHCTLAVIKLRKDDETMEYLNAGQTPLIIKTPDKETKLVKLPSNPLGLELGVEPAVKTMKFVNGSIGILYTDGLTEAKNLKQSQYGTKRLFKMIQSQNQIQCKRIVEGVITNWRDHVSGVPPSDDFCLIGFKKIG